VVVVRSKTIDIARLTGAHDSTPYQTLARCRRPCCPDLRSAAGCGRQTVLLFVYMYFVNRWARTAGTYAGGEA